MEYEKTIKKLDELSKGQHGIIYKLNFEDRISGRLISMGIREGIPFEVIQTFPAYLLKIKNSRIALGKDLTKNIEVYYAE